MAPQLLNKGGKSDLASTAKAGKKGRKKCLKDKSNAIKVSVTENESSTKGKSCGRNALGNLTSSVKQPSTNTQKKLHAVAEENLRAEEEFDHDGKECIEARNEAKDRNIVSILDGSHLTNSVEQPSINTQKTTGKLQAVATKKVPNRKKERHDHQICIQARKKAMDMNMMSIMNKLLPNLFKQPSTNTQKNLPDVTVAEEENVPSCIAEEGFHPDHENCIKALMEAKDMDSISKSDDILVELSKTSSNKHGNRANCVERGEFEDKPVCLSPMSKTSSSDCCWRVEDVDLLMEEIERMSS